MNGTTLETGDQWCPSVPAGWGYLPLRYLGRIVSGGTPNADQRNWNGDVPFVTPPDLRPVVGGVISATERRLTPLGVSTGSAIVPAGSVITSVRAPIGYVARTAMAVAFNQGCRALVPGDRVDARYITHALVAAAPELAAQGRGTTFTELSGMQFASIRVPVPPMEEQRRIADFLDAELDKIDVLIHEQQRLIEMLKVRREAVVSHAVLDATANRVSLRRVAEVIDCAHVTAEFVDDDTRYPVASIRECSGSTVDLAGCNYTTQAYFDLLRAGARAPRHGDLLFIRNVSVGLVSVVDEDTPAFAMGQETVLLRRRPLVDPVFLRYAMTANEVRNAIEHAMIGSTFRRINVSAIRALPIPLPDFDEQVRVARLLDEETAKADSLISEAERFIALSRKRRSALIAAAVTGQIDVRGEVA